MVTKKVPTTFNEQIIATWHELQTWKILKEKISDKNLPDHYGVIRVGQTDNKYRLLDE
jgi:hypothetical protein